MDRTYMARALSLARRAEGRTSPNPMVGAVVVAPDRTVIAEGWHEGPGLPHAEAAALRAVGNRAPGATLYVTLEPCSHYGRTPPCADAVIASGVSRVVAAVLDPNPRVNGKGIARIQAAGIPTTVGVMAREATLLNKGFFTWVSLSRPYVYLKFAQSLDGKIATVSHESKWITCEAARADGHSLRAVVDGIVVGIGTVLADDPRLTARLPGGEEERQPLRIVLDTHARTPLSAYCVRNDPERTLVAVSHRADSSSVRALRAAGVQVWTGPEEGRRVDVRALLSHLAEKGLTSVMVEGGPTVAGSFLDADCVDEVWAYIAPRILGGRAAPGSVAGNGVTALADAPCLTDVAWRAVGDDFKVTGRFLRPHLGDIAAESEGGRA